MVGKERTLRRSEVVSSAISTNARVNASLSVDFCTVGTFESSYIFASRILNLCAFYLTLFFSILQDFFLLL